MDKNESQTKRRRGGQPGNQNARKHGFYTKDGRRKIEESEAFLEDCRAFLDGIATGDFSKARKLIAERYGGEDPGDDPFGDLIRRHK